MILFGHPAGNPNSHNAALAYFERDSLEAFCLPWMPSPKELRLLSNIPLFEKFVSRLERRYFPPLANAPRIEGRISEWSRMARRVFLGGRFASERLSYQANDWLMRTMSRECRRSTVTAVHSFEDCSEWVFEEAKRLGKACIYDLPIGYYPAWERKQSELGREFVEWLPNGAFGRGSYTRPEQKVREMQMADLVLVPCTFVQKTISQFVEVPTALAPYGVDLEYWSPAEATKAEGPLRFIYAGQCSLRKGIPTLFDAWKRFSPKEATLDLVGSWQFNDAKLRELPPGVRWLGPRSAKDLRSLYRASDVFVFPSFFEGFGLVILEAMACGLPVITTEATAGPDILTGDCGRIFSSGSVDELVEVIRYFIEHRDEIPLMQAAARARAEEFSWSLYRQKIAAATERFL